MSGKLLLVRPGGIGDGLLTIPALAALRSARPDLHITFAAPSAIEPIITAWQVCDEFVAVEDRSVQSLSSRMRRVDRARWSGLTECLSWLIWWSPVLVDNLRRLGVRRPLFAPQVGVDPDIHIASHLIDSLAPLGVRRVKPEQVLSKACPPTAWRATGRARPKVALQPGSSSANKNWPLDRFLQLAERFGSQFGAEVTFILGPAERNNGHVIQERSETECWRILEPANLGTLSERLVDYDLFVGNDTGTSHLAGLLGVPTLVIFGPTNPTAWSPLGARVKCLRGHRIAQLPVDVVWKEADVTLGSWLAHKPLV